MLFRRDKTFQRIEHGQNNWVYLGARTCALFLGFVAIVRFRVYYVVFFVLRHCRYTLAEPNNWDSLCDRLFYALSQLRWCDIRHCSRSRFIHVVLKDKRRPITHAFTLSNGVGANESRGKHLAQSAGKGDHLLSKI